MRQRWRVHFPDLHPQPGQEIELPAAEAHHVRRVLRLRPGERLAVFNGAGQEWWATLTRAEAAGVFATIGEAIDAAVECELEVALFQGWCDPARMDWIVQKGTELGLASIHPLGGDGSTRAPSERRLRRWRRIAIEACKQCGRRRLPRIEPHDRPPRPPREGTLALLLDAGPQAVPLAARLIDPVPRRLWLAAGPAEGWGEGAVGRLAAEGWKPVALGPRILRAETAGLVAATIVLHRWGDLGAAQRGDARPD